MIRINIKNEVEYARIRKEFLNKISKYVWFNKEDIVSDEENKNKRKQTRKENKTEQTATDLKNNFPELYGYLFKKNTGEVDRERLRYLLAGPEEMPKSLGGCGEEDTMLECLDNIINVCKIENSLNKEKVRECCERIFNYDGFIKGQREAYWLLRNLNVRVCPYCNRIYTVTLPSPEELEKGEEFKATRATFDHFYCRAEYQFLAVSLFNLIPSCYTCNLNKSNSMEKFVYPYDQEFGKDAVFRIIPNLSKITYKYIDNILNYLHGGNGQFYIKFMGRKDVYLWGGTSLEERLSDIDDEKLRERIIISIRKFKLEELYKEHKQEIRDILRNRYYFDDEYVKTVICPMIRKKMQKLHKKADKEEIEKIAMDMLYFSHLRSEKWGQRPLSKLISDILEQVSGL